MLLFLNTCSSFSHTNGHNDLFRSDNDKLQVSLHKSGFPGENVEEGAGIFRSSRSGEESAHIFPSSASESAGPVVEEDGNGRLKDCWGRRRTLSSTIRGAVSSPVGRVQLASEDEEEAELLEPYVRKKRYRGLRLDQTGPPTQDTNLTRQGQSNEETYVRKKRLSPEHKTTRRSSIREEQEDSGDGSKESEDYEDPPESRVVEDAWEFGMQQMHDLYAVKEPELYKQGN